MKGNPDSLNPHMHIYVPYCLQIPLLAQVAIHISEYYLHETNHLDKMAEPTHKSRAIYMLNMQIGGIEGQCHSDSDRRLTSYSDDAIASVIQLIMDEWYWGQAQNLHAHLQVLREMVRVRGGLQNLGMNGLISKLATAYVLCPLPSFFTVLQSVAPNLIGLCI